MKPAFLLFFRTNRSISQSENAKETTKRSGKIKLSNGSNDSLTEYKTTPGKIANKIVWIKLNSLTLNDINFTKIFPY